jgi:hypothetical protein
MKKQTVKITMNGNGVSEIWLLNVLDGTWAQDLNAGPFIDDRSMKMKCRAIFTHGGDVRYFEEVE